MEIFKKIMKYVGIIFSFIIANGSAISLAIMNMIEIGNGEISISYWDALSSKVVCKIVNDFNPDLWLPEYHWYNKFLVILFIIIGIIISILIIYWIIKSKKTLRDLKITHKFESDIEKKAIYKQELQSQIQTIENKIESGIATDKDLKDYKKLSNKLKKII